MTSTEFDQLLESSLDELDTDMKNCLDHNKALEYQELLMIKSVLHDTRYLKTRAIDDSDPYWPTYLLPPPGSVSKQIENY